jgi:hypothetical protein
MRKVFKFLLAWLNVLNNHSRLHHPLLQTVYLLEQIILLVLHELLNLGHDFDVLLRQLQNVLDIEFANRLLRLVIVKTHIVSYT